VSFANQAAIRRRKTGFAPYEKDGAIGFDHQWMLLIGQK